MKSKSLREQIKELLRCWRMLTTDQIRNLLRSKAPVKDQSLFTVLKRMRKSSELYSFRLRSLHLNFDPFWIKRMNLIKAQPKDQQAKVFRSCNLLHHLELTNLYLQWQNEFSILEVFPNVSTKANVASKSMGGKLSAPDLMLRFNPTTSIYIEYERSLKSERRYQEKWWAYEDDQGLQSCLYFLEDSSHLFALQKLADNFFSRKIGREGFRLGFITMNSFKRCHFNAPLVFHSMRGIEKESIYQHLEPVLEAVPDLSKPTRFSLPTTDYPWPISALRADSSPTTITNEWVLKDVREESARRAP